MRLDTTLDRPKPTLRDLGGYRTTTGQTVRRRRLYRARGGGTFAVKTVIDFEVAGELANADHQLPAMGSLELDAEIVAETLAILTDPWAYPVVLHCSDRSQHVVATVLGVLGLSARDIRAEAGVTDIRRRYGSFDGYAAAIGVGSAPAYIRAALLAPSNL